MNTTTDRIQRAFALKVQPLGGEAYRVTGGARPQGHLVDLIDPARPTCSCRDHLTRQLACKHIVACLLSQSAAAQIAAVAQVAGVRA